MHDLTLVSLFDGIGGFPLAFERAGARTVATVEIDKAAAAISARHFPHATQFDDVTKVTGDDLRTVGFVPDRGILTAGWPCQDLSVAGRREGLAGARSGLWWEVVRILDETHPRWFVGENVPGLLSSNSGQDMGAVVGALGELGYGFAARVLDAQHFGVPQRRRRVFFVGHLGEPFACAAEVLFECESSAGDFTSGGEAGPGAAAGTAWGAGIPSQALTHTHTHTQSRRCRAAGNADTGSTPNQQQAGTSSWAVAALTAKQGGPDDNSAQAGHLIVEAAEQWAGAFHMTQDPISSETHTPCLSANAQIGVAIPIDMRNAARDSTAGDSCGTGIGEPGDPSFTLTKQANGLPTVSVQPLALRGREGGAMLEVGADDEPAFAIRAEASTQGVGSSPLVAVHENQRGELTTSETMGALTTGGGKPGQGYPAVSTDTVVRRLTPTECERLQGYPDNYTEGQPDSARYRQLGNSVAVPCVEWIAHRLIAVAVRDG